MEEKSYSYDRFGSTGQRVGQAVYDVLSQDQPTYSAEEILDEMANGIVSYIEEAVNKGCEKYEGKFYLLHLFKKHLCEHGIENAMLQKATCFQNRRWTPQEVMEAHPHSSKTLYEVDKVNGVAKLLWTVPGWEDCKSIKKNPTLYDPDLVKWVNEATQNAQEEAS